jgi:hypothetical protein
MKKIFSLFLVLTSLISFSQERKEIGVNFIKTLLTDKNAEKAHSFLIFPLRNRFPLLN